MSLNHIINKDRLLKKWELFNRRKDVSLIREFEETLTSVICKTHSDVNNEDVILEKISAIRNSTIFDAIDDMEPKEGVFPLLNTKKGDIYYTISFKRDYKIYIRENPETGRVSFVHFLNRLKTSDLIILKSKYNSIIRNFILYN